MHKLSKLKLKDFNNSAVRTGFVVGFAAMTSAAVINALCWAVLGEAAAPGKAGFVLAFGVSLFAALFSALLNLRQSRSMESIASHAEAIALGNIETAFVSPQGAIHPIHLQLNLIAEAQLKRIEEFHRLLEDSRIREERLYEALDQMDDEITVYDPTGMLVTVNKAFTRHCNGIGARVGPGMLRRDVLQAMATAPGNGVPSSERDMWLEHQFQMRELAISSTKPVDTLQRDGRHMRFTVIETPLKNQIEITTDITDMVTSMLEVERSHREVEAAARIKSVTVARLMNTIRTPMTGVLAAAELLNETPLNANQQGKLDLIRRSSGTLLGIVQDMIDVADGARGAVVESGEPFELVNVNNPKRAVLLIRSPELLEKITLVLKKDAVQSISLETVDLVRELLEDTDGESINVDFVMSDDSQACEQLLAHEAVKKPESRIRVIDLNKVMTDGFGMPEPQELTSSPELAPSEVPPIEVAASSADIADDPAEANDSGGNKAVEALETAQDTEARGFTELPRSGLRVRPIEVMVVEDNDVNQIIYDQIMSNSGYHYLIVSSGEEAVNTALREKPNLILMDISMPGVNGIDATKRIRSRLSSDKKPVIVGMTQHVLSGDREKCLMSGMDDYCVKPTSAGPLRAQIANWLGLASQKTGMTIQA